MARMMDKAGLNLTPGVSESIDTVNQHIVQVLDWQGLQDRYKTQFGWMDAPCRESCAQQS
jgi:hypothetical protein